MGEGTSVKALRAGATVEPVGRRSGADSCTERRYVVTEIEGYLSPQVVRHSAPPGVSFQVTDRLNAHRVVAQWRTEDYGGRSFGSRAYKITALRELARERCDLLNALHEIAAA
jgi:hypothetical protein